MKAQNKYNGSEISPRNRTLEPLRLYHMDYAAAISFARSNMRSRSQARKASFSLNCL